MNEHVIETSKLTRYFAGKCAVDQLTLKVPRGAVLALLGRNGSGKTTLIRMLLGLLSPTRGSATILGEDCRRIRPQTRARIAYVAEGHPLINWMRVSDLENLQRGSFPQWDPRTFRTIIDHFSLTPKMRASSVSRGQRAGLSLALALATRPELLLMDDPAMGLDPVARRMLLEAMILLMRDSGHTILFSSHILDDVERVADHIAILDRSILRVSCPVETFRDRVKRLVLTFAGEPPVPTNIPGLLETRREGNELRLVIANHSTETDRAIAALAPISVTDSTPNLEDAVIAYLRDRNRQTSLLQQSPQTQVTP